MSPYNYPNIAKSERKDTLVPDPQEYDMSDPDGTEVLFQSAKSRLDLFSRLMDTAPGKKFD